MRNYKPLNRQEHYHVKEWMKNETNFSSLLGAVMLLSAALPVLVSSAQAVAVSSAEYIGYQVTGPYPILRVEGT
jgi:hypothetical protein